MNTQHRPEITTRTVLMSIILALAGLLLILASFLPGYMQQHELVRDVFRELGIAVFAVFTVSLIYERLLAERHLAAFTALLRGEIEQAEKNAAACTQLGIVEIFATRDVFEYRNPLNEFLAGLTHGSQARFVAVTLFHVMNKTDILRHAVESGADIELCLLSPTSPPTELAKIPDLEIDDIRSALSQFKKKLAKWVEETRPAGRLELRYHNSPVPESFTWALSPARRTGVWDLSFGRDLREKRIFMLDLDRPFGKDLRNRFDAVYESASVVFKYEHAEITVNNLGTAGDES